jgi:hypothetical protein
MGTPVSGLEEDPRNEREVFLQTYGCHSSEIPGLSREEIEGSSQVLEALAEGFQVALTASTGTGAVEEAKRL